ncbi:MAG: AMP-binding protein [Solirubrobacteraceae bacterium]|jgi:crotonobetaine/carnitine-CoA ligase
MSARLRGLPAAEQTLPALLERQAAAHGARPFVTSTGGETRSYAELREAAATWGGMLHAAGIARGDRVATIAGNSLELVELLLGCAWIGAIAVPLDTALRGAALAQALAGAGVRALLIETEHLDALARVPPPASLQHVWLLDRERPHRAHGYLCEPLPALDERVAAAAVRPGDTFAIFYGAGGGGVCCPHAQLYWWGLLDSELLAVDVDEVCFTTLPLFRAETIASLCTALVAGASWVCAPRFAPSRYWRLAAEHGATRAYLPGGMTAALLAQPRSRDDKAHSVALGLAHGAAEGSDESFRRRYGVALRDGYRSTPTGRVTGVPGDPLRPGTVGRALPEFELAIVDPDDVQLADGEAGELVLRPREPNAIATGYFRMAEATASAWRNLWFHTGQRAVRDPDGFFKLVEPPAETINRRGGGNVASDEVERVLAAHPDIVAAAVFAVPSELGGEDVMATIVLGPGRELDPVDLIEFCRPRLAAGALPRYLEVTRELPLSGEGSVRRDVLRERGVRAGTWDREHATKRLARH